MLNNCKSVAVIEKPDKSNQVYQSRNALLDQFKKQKSNKFK